MSVREIVELVCIGVVLLALLIYYIITAIKNKYVSQIYDTLVSAMRFVETQEMSSAEKKEYVLKAVEDKCMELGIPYKFIKSLVDKLIEKIISHYNTMIK